MPAIGKRTIVLEDNTKVEFNIFYSTKKKFYIKEIPEKYKNISKISSWSNEGHVTEDALRMTFRKAIYEYAERTKSQRKVLIIDFQVGRETPVYLHHQHEKKYDKIPSNGKDWGLALQYKIKMEVSSEIEKKYYEIKENGELGYGWGLSKGDIVVPWTEEREKFFIKFKDELNWIADQFGRFITSKHLDALLDEGGTVLLSNFSSKK